MSNAFHSQCNGYLAKAFCFSYLNLDKDTVPDTTYNTKKEIWVFYSSKLIIKAHLSSDSNNNLCP